MRDLVVGLSLPGHGHAAEWVVGKANGREATSVCLPDEMHPAVDEGMQPSGVGSRVPPPWAEVGAA